MTDKELYYQVRREALAQDGSVANQLLIQNLDKLTALYGETFSIDGACHLLETLSQKALLWRDELRKVQS